MFFKLFLVILLGTSLTTNSFAFTLAMPSFVKGWQAKPIEIQYSQKNCGMDILPALKDAIALWNTIHYSSLHLVLGKELDIQFHEVDSATFGGTPIVLCHSQLSTLIGNSEYIPAVTQVSYSTSEIQYGIVIMNSEEGKYANISNISSEKLRIVLAHEIGHVLGLGHSGHNTALMYYNASSKTQLSLSQDEVDGISYLYPRNDFGPEMFSCATVQSPLSKKSVNLENSSNHIFSKQIQKFFSNFLMLVVVIFYTLIKRKFFRRLQNGTA